MPNIAVFPGSFDPITKGHESIVHRALPLFDKIIVAVGYNANKKSVFSVEQRVYFIKKTFADTPNVIVASYEGLTVDFCEKHKAKFLLRGLRGIADFKNERMLASINKELCPDLETIFMCPGTAYNHISSTIVREVLRNDGDISNFLPKALQGYVKLQ
ncbi:MAG: pantetheine-phosphate adenylyltransferase [Bacteroidales bacterium]|nr:pantetheine-phosphate adenylyltransferase [Bacteroidales bacterium]